MLTTPADNELLTGVVLWPQRMLVVKLASKTARALAIWVSWIAGSYTDESVPAPSELATPAPAPVFSGVGSKPPTGMPWAPSEMTRTTSELSRPIRIASGNVRCQISSASGDSVVRGRAILGGAIGRLPVKLACLTSLSSAPMVPIGSRGTDLDWSM